MRGKAHLRISGFLCQCFAILVYKDFTPVAFVIGALFGLLADIDEEQSKISYLLIKKTGGSRRIGGVNHHKTDTKYNSRLKKKRQVALTVVLILIGAALFVISKKNIFFSIGCLYVSYLPWTTHRTLSHSIFSSLVVGVCAYLSFNLYGLGKYGVYCGVGYFLHIFEDSFTVSGTPLFYPFSKKKYKIPLMSTGTDKGNLVEALFMMASICLCIAAYLFVR